MATPQGSNTRKPGVLPMPAQAHAQNQPDATKPTKGRSTAAQDGVKAKVRWLPPALTEEEFFSILGSVWKPGSGKVNWFSYNPGKMPKRSVLPSVINSQVYVGGWPLTSDSYIAHPKTLFQHLPFSRSKRTTYNSLWWLCKTPSGKMRKVHSTTRL